MTTQRDKDESASWTQTVMSQAPKKVFADGAEYARKEMAEHLRGVHYEYLVGGNTTVCAALEALIERLEAP